MRIHLRRRAPRLPCGATAGLAVVGLLAAITAAPAAPAAAAVAVSETYVRPADGVFQLAGRGYGHGRGMSQNGAQGAAAVAGKSWQEIVSTYYPGTTLTAAGNPRLRVRLTASPGPQLTLSGDLRALLDQVSGVRTPLASGTTSCTLSPSATGLTAACPGNPTWEPGRVTDVEGAGLVGVRFPDGTLRKYRGGAVRVVRTGASQVTGVALPVMDEYLYGVVPREMPASWHPQALRAQAVAARTYADFERRSAAAAAEWDTCDSTSCQVFGGTYEQVPGRPEKLLEDPATNAAVDATSGTEVFSSGAPAFTQFSAANGGWSTAGSRPYLVARADPWDGLTGSASHRWDGVLPVTALEQAWPQLGRFERMVITSRDGNGEWGGRVLQATLHGRSSSGAATSVAVTGEQIRSAWSFSGSRSQGLRSSWFVPTNGRADPFGSLDAVSTAPGGITVSGWAIDPETTAPIQVHVYVDNTGTALVADQSRPDVGSAYPGFGDRHGYSATIAAAAGQRRVCAYAINTGAGDNVQLGCRTVVVPSPDPFGSFDGAAGGPASVQVSGWAIDPDTSGAVQVHVYVDGRGTALLADRDRPDVGAAYPAFGSRHGFSAAVPASPGRRSVCAYAINVGAGTNRLLSCREVTVPTGDPFGSLDSATGVAGGIAVGGWAIDPDTASPIQVHVYVGAAGTAMVADVSRPDVARAYPGYGDRHGYSRVVPAPPGDRQVCAYAINAAAGTNRLLACRVVRVP